MPLNELCHGPGGFTYPTCAKRFSNVKCYRPTLKLSTHGSACYAQLLHEYIRWAVWGVATVLLHARIAISILQSRRYCLSLCARTDTVVSRIIGNQTSSIICITNILNVTTAILGCLLTSGLVRSVTLLEIRQATAAPIQMTTVCVHTILSV